MSQEKVDKYKAQKANRKAIMKKEKMKHRMRQLSVAVVGLVIVGWLGYSAYNVYESKKPKQTAEVDYKAITEYQQNLTADAAEE